MPGRARRFLASPLFENHADHSRKAGLFKGILLACGALFLFWAQRLGTRAARHARAEQDERRRLEEELRQAREALEREGAGRTAELQALLAAHIEAEKELYRSRERLRALLDASTDAAFLIARDGTFLAANQALAQAMRRPLEALIGADAFAGLPPEMIETRRQKVEEVFRTGTPVQFEDLSITGWSDNSVFPVFSSDGVVEAVAFFSRDVNDEKWALEALRESEERYALAARGANDGLWDLNLQTNLIYLSPRWRAMLGCTMDDVGNDPEDMFKLIHPDDEEKVRARFKAHLEGHTPHFECEHRMLHRDGSIRWVLNRGLAVRDANGVPVRIAGSMTEITDRKRVEDKLIHDAFHDALTGLPNRALLTDRLEQAIKHYQRHTDQPFALLYMDLDRFKDVNDSLGHSIGDQLLVAAAQRVQGCLRAADTLARLGGDEFVILLPDVKDAADAISVAERIQAQLRMPFILNGLEVVTSVSIGIVLGENGHKGSEEILRDADIAMYRAKALGKAQYQIFDTSMRNQVVNRMRLEADLRTALNQQGLEVHYHPILELATGAYTHFEALVRWRHPQHGLIMPADFIPMAEESLLVIPLDRWVLREACRQVKSWQEHAAHNPGLLRCLPFKLSVNLSGKQFAQPDLIETIQSVLQTSGFAAHDLRVEITESAIMENINMATQTLKRLQALGVKVEIDDFGTGFSSLTYLFELPVNALKIDRSFISQLGSEERKTEIVRTIVHLAHNIGMEVVAEGVETTRQLELLREMRCDFAQGFLFSRPLEGREVEEFIRERA